MTTTNVWLQQRLTEQAPCRRSSTVLAEPQLADHPDQAVRGPGTGARGTDQPEDPGTRLNRAARQPRQPARRGTAKRDAATQRAETALGTLIKTGEPITFRGLARTAGVSIDFLYRSPLRARVEQLPRRPATHATRPRRASAGDRAAGVAEQRRAHTHRPARRPQAPPPRRDTPLETAARRRPGREPPTPPPARAPRWMTLLLPRSSSNRLSR